MCYQPAGWLLRHGQYRICTQYFGNVIKKNVYKIGRKAVEQGGVPGKLDECGLFRPVPGANTQIELQELIVRSHCRELFD